MNNIDFEKQLNSEQMRAVASTDGAVLVSAGAGSGKTRLLTYRIAYLVEKLGINPYNILAITFTNKAASEMKNRVADLIDDAEFATVCTIHSFCAKLLRTYIQFLNGYNSNFSIYSETDSNKIFKDIFKEMSIDDEDTKNKIKNDISTLKNENMSIDEYVDLYQFSNIISLTRQVYESYQQKLQLNNAMDFDDLLTNTYRLLSQNPEVLSSVQNRYLYIHVDEFQDTNVVQYQIIRLIASRNSNLFVVGDENQSIYGWRGANPDNMRQFLLDFKNAQIMKLEKNYRSVMPILKSANELIKFNNNLIEKQLYSDKTDGGHIEYYSAYDENDEADFAVRKILQLNARGISFDEMAILMRINALSRPFEEKLLMYNIPHRIYNGFKFYERQEIKNTLAYLIACANPDDNNNLQRIINFPKRAIGVASVEKMLLLADSQKTTLKNIVLNFENYDLPNALKQKLLPLKQLLQDFDEKAVSMPLYEFAEYVISQTGILSSFDLANETEIERSHNVNSLLQSIKDYSKRNEGATYTEYLESVTLVTNLDEMETGQNSVSIASIHGAKGLEFNTVFICGAEENILPITRENFDNLEEERRLMYVAITRAKENLFVTSCKSRFLYGRRERALPSRFLKEAQIVKEVNIPAYNFNDNFKFDSFKSYKTFVNTADKQVFKEPSPKIDISKINVGTKVNHARFGIGKIVNINDLNRNKSIDVEFANLGIKTLNVDFAPLTLI